MTTLPNMGLTLPTRGAPGAGQWGNTLDADLQLTDAHDHTPGKGSRIVSAALNINADVSWSSLFAPTNLHRAQFASVAALSSNAQNKSIFVADGTGGLSANELYWRNNTGNNVKLTSGNALNVAAFVGGIGGDYTAVGAALNFDDSGKRYTHKDGSGNWARLASGEVRLIETGTTEAVFVGHQAPAGLASSYTVTWPLAVPGSTAIMQMDSAGVLTASNTVSQAATFSALLTTNAGITVSSGGAAITGASSITGNATVTGNLNVTGTVTFGETNVYSMAFAVIAGGAAIITGGGAAGSPPLAAIGTLTSGAINCPLRFRIGTTLTAWQVRIIKNTGAVTISAKMFKASSGSSVTQIGVTQSSSANAPGLIPLGQGSLSEVIASNTNYFIEIVGSGSSGDLGVDYQATTA